MHKKIILTALAFLALTMTNVVYAVDSISDAKIIKLHIYKDYRSVVQLDKGSETNGSGCTHVNNKLIALVLQERHEESNVASIEEMYSALLAARFAGTPVNVLTSGCVPFGGYTIPKLIMVVV